MSGVEIIAQLLRGHAPITAIVPLDRIRDAALDVGGTAPALVVEQISSVDQRLLDQTVPTFMTDRVQVTIAARDTDQRRLLTRLVREACAGQRGDMFGLMKVDVQTDGQGPDFADGAPRIFMRTQDFRVAYNTAA